ncbi:hypothetical protein CKM354_000081300 [Cercospora kikuchii]|uniref:Ricin B lectin domain-containing protein n=1 Tax=Cercospora kikuchii TaxID=84275 RepID=A0A9P3CER5_9PEZI|nr:uncharacterized protein CKM354_000081300 [Cercospora kikuchii]GIZ37363.1 hypothetical protein CKM354_000081300 [Cercospora kikuchii]
MSDFVGAGTYLIAGAKFPNMFIDLNNGNKQDGTKLSAWDNSKSANAHWQVGYANVGKTGKEEYLLLNRASGTYLTVSDKGKEVTCTTQSPLNDVTRWNIIPLRNGTGRYWIAPVSNKTLGLHMAGGNGSKGSQIHTWSAAGDSNEMSQWYLYAVEGVPQNFPDTAKGSPPK